MARARANPAFNTDVPWAALRAGPRAGGQLCVEGQLQGGEFVPIDDCNGCAPCKGGAFQWVQVPPGNRSSRKQPEQLWR